MIGYLSVHIADINTTFMMKQNCFTFSVRVNANIIFILLVVRYKRLNNEVIQYSASFADLKLLQK